MGDADWLIAGFALLAREALLFAAIGFLVGGIDDVAVDIVWVWQKLRGRLVAVDATALPPPRRPLAIFVPAWDESAVIGAMLRHTAATLAERDLAIFVGAYPNDRATISAIADVASRDDRIRLVVLDRAGPTTKADCLNGLWRAMRRDEWHHGRRFAGVILHDAEDIVHKCELRVLGAMLGSYDAAQLPVRPLVVPGSPLVSGHYCDEFAEAHGKQLPVREALGAAMPFAGVGCAIRRDMLAAIARRRDGNPFDAVSLTEDYELGLAVSALGGTVGFARARDPVSGRLVAVAGYFPATIESAVRQKARWMTGIALAGWDRTGWGHRASVAEWWMRMRDRRAILAVMTLVAAYAGLVATAFGLAVGHVTGVAAEPLSAGLKWMLMATALVLGWRIIVRIAWVWHGYGTRAAMLAVPRLFVGNVIAMLAARRAVAQYIRILRGELVRWDKTDHRFPHASELGR